LLVLVEVVEEEQQVVKVEVVEQVVYVPR